MAKVKWVEPLLEKAKKEAATVKNDTNRKYILQGLDLMEKHKGSIEKLGEQGFKVVIGLLGRGDKAEAKKAFLEAVMDPEALIEDAGDAADNVMNAPSMDWEETVTEILSGLGEIVAKALGSMLLSI